MSQVGEGIAIPLKRLTEGKCVFCGKADHDKPKKDKIDPTNWKRESFSGVGGRHSAKKLSIYPNRTSPPTGYYKSEGHHCLAFSSFIVGAQSKPPNPTDRYAALNHYLKEKKYDPNNESNRIDLPGRKDKGEEDPTFHYFEFAKSVEHNKPLQVHIGSHAGDFMNESNYMIRNIVRTFQQRNLCDQPDGSFKDELLKEIEDAEDEAFENTAGAISPWICHPAHIKKAEAFAKHMLNLTTDIEYPNLNIC